MGKQLSERPRCRRWAGYVLAGVVLCLGGTPVLAEFRLSTLYSDNMVFQRQHPVTIRGTGTPGAKVEVSLASQKKSASVAGDGKWSVTLEPLAVGGPYTLRATSEQHTLEVRNALCGDVWLCSGQSNMQLAVKETQNAADEVRGAGELSTVRFLTVPKFASDNPVEHVDAKWQLCSSQSASNFSAVGYFFGRELKSDPKLKDVPIGLIDSSFGGTAAEGWMPAEALSQSGVPQDKWQQSMFGLKSSSLYNAMVAPLTANPIAGVIWYQGEANAGMPSTYEQLLSTMIGSWRSRWNDDSLPFLIVQLPSYSGKMGNYRFTWVREAQQRVALHVSNTGMAVSVDTNDGMDLHPKQKKEVGRRLALLARRIAYHEDVMCSGPTCKAAQQVGNTVRLRFDNVGSGLVMREGGALTGFQIAGSDGEYRYAAAKVDGDSVVISSELVRVPTQVRYAWAGIPVVRLYNQEGLPASPFRTDTFAPVEMEIERGLAPRNVVTAKYSVTIRGDGMVSSIALPTQGFVGSVYHEFLANGPDGGCYMPVFLGRREFQAIRELGPNVLLCADSDVSVRYQFTGEGMEWEIANKSKDPATMNIIMAANARLEGRSGGEATLSVDECKLRVSSISKTMGENAGKPWQLECQVQPNQTQTIRWTIQP